MAPCGPIRRQPVQALLAGSEAHVFPHHPNRLGSGQDLSPDHLGVEGMGLLAPYRQEERKPGCLAAVKV